MNQTSVMDFAEAAAFLDALQFFKIKLGLDSMRDFLARLDHPEKAIPCVHIAGTNGKGSVAATLLAVLSAAGCRVGLYTSPHLSSVRERFRINDRYISRQDFARTASAIRGILNNRQITYFEFTTALAFLWFQQEKVDVAIIETGLGGRLDATNVITPLVSVITNVSMDHEAYLGNTLELIAAEKAGIVKPGVAVISGVGEPRALGVVEEKCAAMAAPLYHLGREFRLLVRDDGTWDYRGIDRQNFSFENLPCTLSGRYQRDNSALALAALEVLAGKGFHLHKDAVVKGLPQVRWPGRLELCRADLENLPGGREQKVGKRRKKRFLFDGAHNPAGVKTLTEALVDDFTWDRLLLVWGAMADKDMASALPLVATLSEKIFLTQPESERSATPGQLYALLPPEEQVKALCCATLEEALRQAYEAAGENDMICIAGSLYLVGRARQLLVGELAT